MGGPQKQQQAQLSQRPRDASCHWIFRLVNVASVTLVQLPGIPYLTVLSLSLTPMDFKIF